MFNSGDKVIFNNSQYIITYKSENNRYFITAKNIHNVSGKKVKKWVDGTDLKLDVQFYREQKINEIINEN